MNDTENTLKALIDEVRRLAEEKPGFIYEAPGSTRCVYVYDGKGSCIVGQASINIGLITDDFEYHPYNVDTNVLVLLPEILGGSFDYDEYEASVDWLLRVQQRQDDSWEWSSSVEDADEAFPLAG